MHYCHIEHISKYLTIIGFNEVDIGIYLPENVIIHRGKYPFEG